MLGGQVIPVCSVVALAYPELESSHQPWLPAFLSPTPGEDPVQLMVPNARHRLAGERYIRPSDEARRWLQRHRIARVNVMLEYCVDPTGAVDDIEVLVPTMAPGYDERLVEGIRGWRFTPILHHGQPVRTCSLVQFVYTQH